MELVLVLQGEVVLFSVGSQRRLLPGDVAMVRAREPHACQGLVDDNVLLGLQIDPWLTRHDSQFGRRAFDLTVQHQDAESMKRVAKVRSLMARTMLEIRMKRAGWPMEVEALVLRLLAILLRQVPCTLSESDGCVPFPQEQVVLGARLHAVADYIRRHAHEPLSIEDVARNHSLSAGYLSRLFKSEAGEGFHSFVTNLRLRRALEMMSVPRARTLTCIALECGFPSSRAFNVSFRRTLGCTPSTWRARYLETAAQSRSGLAYGVHHESLAMQLLHSLVMEDH
ncbi:AraC family transcriptional regulator [Roseateles sp. LYH14W]|uniref:AraC family transcriptional regulator n=1 Tax=Pelomonas parva TaxID=3299032 RepID=A0ABW7F926_9BURK